MSVSTFFGFYLALASSMEPSVCTFFETKTPSAAYEFASLFAEFRDSTDHLIHKRKGNSVVRSNLNDTVRFFVSAEQYVPAGFTYAVYVKSDYEKESFLLQLEQFVSRAQSLGFNAVACNLIADIEIPTIEDW